MECRKAAREKLRIFFEIVSLGATELAKYGLAKLENSPGDSLRVPQRAFACRRALPRSANKRHEAAFEDASMSFVRRSQARHREASFRESKQKGARGKLRRSVEIALLCAAKKGLAKKASVLFNGGLARAKLVVRGPKPRHGSSRSLVLRRLF